MYSILCFTAVNLGDPCTPGQNDACQLGDGGLGAICSGTSTCGCDTGSSYVESGGTCKKGETVMFFNNRCGQYLRKSITVTDTLI